MDFGAPRFCPVYVPLYIICVSMARKTLTLAITFEVVEIRDFIFGSNTWLTPSHLVTLTVTFILKLAILELHCFRGHSCFINTSCFRYKIIKERNSKTGSERHSWKYYDNMDEMLRGDPAACAISSASSLRVAEDSATTCKKNTPSSPVRPLSVWLLFYAVSATKAI